MAASMVQAAALSNSAESAEPKASCVLANARNVRHVARKATEMAPAAGIEAGATPSCSGFCSAATRAAVALPIILPWPNIARFTGHNRSEVYELEP